ncbi:MAG: D-amino acid dehydrogenase [Mesorhizobium sp.]|nr:MAG: D-amino acid dehydrogenase [Mesorhizobium sp.]
MKIFVLGGGVIGVTTAYYLAEAGHEVTVIDRQKGPALETSFANAGEISPGYASPWAGPGVPLKAIKWLLMKHGPLVVRPTLDPHMWVWLVRMLRNCTAERYAVNKARMVPLAEYSRDTLKALREASGIAYDERAKGTLQLFRTQQQLDGTAGDVEVLKAYGVPYEILDPDGCISAEPGLAGVREKFVGGLRLPGDETGDCKMFTDRLAELCVARGVTFEYDTEIRRVVKKRNRIANLNTSKGWKAADAYVMAMGSYSAKFMRTLKRPVPVYPVKGYTATLQLEDESKGPTMGGADEDQLIGYSRLGNRLRLASTAEFTGFDRTHKPSDFAAMFRTGNDLFPGAFDENKAELWAGLRPMMPSSVPVIGQARYRNLYLDTGHGHVGWTMACGSGRFLADVVSGRKPEIDPQGLVYKG